MRVRVRAYVRVALCVDMRVGVGVDVPIPGWTWALGVNVELCTLFYDVTLRELGDLHRCVAAFVLLPQHGLPTARKNEIDALDTPMERGLVEERGVASSCSAVHHLPVAVAPFQSAVVQFLQLLEAVVVRCGLGGWVCVWVCVLSCVSQEVR